MAVATEMQAAPARVADDLSLADLKAALVAGWGDFRARPGFGLFFAAVFALGGLGLGWAMLQQGQAQWLVFAAAGFPIVAPFAAVGFYEISRRRELGLPIGWGDVLGAVRGRGDDQVLMMGVILFVAFGFWVIIAHAVYAAFLPGSAIGGEALALLSAPGLAMLAVGSAVGALIAFAFFSVTVISLPMLVDRDIDFITAIITSVAVVRANRPVMLAWAGLIAIALFAGMLPGFLGLFLVLPVLGHATWHLYRRAVSRP